MTNGPATVNGTTAHYQQPGWITRNVLNRLVARLTRMGVSVAGSRVLRVRGRKSGRLRSNPVNVLTLDGERYLVAPRGLTDWVRNLRIAGGGELVVGRKVEAFTATELVTGSGDGATEALVSTVLRGYLRRWKWEVGQFFDGVGPDSTDDELLAMAPNHPIFRIVPVSP
ncbi:MAG: nitroreductase/quinone reductase family protein [Actinomycetota bacterium]|nr:nitroreductase/quinone reductase family protein [Actinomycetota bacterium]